MRSGKTMPASHRRTVPRVSLGNFHDWPFTSLLLEPQGHGEEGREPKSARSASRAVGISNNPDIGMDGDVRTSRPRWPGQRPSGRSPAVERRPASRPQVGFPDAIRRIRRRAASRPRAGRPPGPSPGRGGGRAATGPGPDRRERSDPAPAAIPTAEARTADLLKCSRQVMRGILGVARAIFQPCPCDALGRIDQSFASRIVPRPADQRADRVLHIMGYRDLCGLVYVALKGAIVIIGHLPRLATRWPCATATWFTLRHTRLLTT